MNCAQARTQLAAYSAGLVQGDERIAIRDHIGACEECAAALGEYQAIDDRLTRSQAAPGEGFVAGIMDEVSVMPAQRRPAWLEMAEGIGPMVTVATALPAAGLCIVGFVAATVAGVGEPVTVEAAATLGATMAMAGAAAGAVAWAVLRTTKTAL